MKSKKVISVAVALLGAAAVLGGCKTNKPDEYGELNDMLALHYSQIDLKVTNTFDEETVLVSEYKMKFTDGGITVNYSVERFAEVSLSGSASPKTTLVGEATIAGGAVTYTQGDAVNLDAISSGVGFEFEEEYFENAELTGIYLKADVKNPSAFMRSELSCTEMKVSATFLEVFYDIQITYRAETGNKVEYLYTFTI